MTAGRRCPASPRATSAASTTTWSGRRPSCRSTRTTCSSIGWCPQAPDRTLVICDWLFEASTIAQEGFDPSDEIAFWDLTNGQDWHVCELQQRGTRSSSWVAGRYSNQEASVHAFDQMVADRYEGRDSWSQRIVREQYDQPVPKTNRGITATNGSNGHGADGHGPDGNGVVKDRTAARAKATADRG